ncbi:hypothetical protein D3C84_826500 [compost metagenome]
MLAIAFSALSRKYPSESVLARNARMVSPSSRTSRFTSVSWFGLLVSLSLRMVSASTSRAYAHHCSSPGSTCGGMIDLAMRSKSWTPLISLNSVQPAERASKGLRITSPLKLNFE